MEYQDQWRAFVKTGSIKDYLHYTAVCAADELAAGIAEDDRNGEIGGFQRARGSDSHGDGGIGHAYRRI